MERKICAVKGIPRGKATYNMNLPREILQKVNNARRWTKLYAPVGILGYPGSGRKTLAHRFRNVTERNTGTFTEEEVPAKYVYPYVYWRKFDDNTGHLFLLKLYIVNPGALFPDTIPDPLKAWREFCCMVFVFDITEKHTFLAVPQYLSVLRNDDIDIQENFFIVGNKSDLRRFDEARHSQVSKRSATSLASKVGGTYYECSAKENINVNLLRHAVTKCAFKRRYVIK